MTTPTPRKRGRPKHLATPTATTLLRLDQATASKLKEIAGREGLTYGGQPSPAQAVRFLVARDEETR